MSAVYHYLTFSIAHGAAAHRAQAKTGRRGGGEEVFAAGAAQILQGVEAAGGFS